MKKQVSFISILALAMCLGVPVFAGIGDDVGFQANEGEEAVRQVDEQGKITITDGKAAGKSAQYLQSTEYKLDAIYVEAGIAKDAAAAKAACAALAPAGAWTLPDINAAMAAVYMGVVTQREIGKIGDQPLAVPPALWPRATTPEQEEQLKDAALTFKYGIVGMSEQGFEMGYQPIPFKIDEAIKGQEQMIKQLEEQVSGLEAATPHTLALQGYEGVTQEQIDQAIEQAKAKIEASKQVIESLKQGIPVTCVAGTVS